MANRVEIGPSLVCPLRQNTDGRGRVMGGWKRKFLAKTQSAQRIGFVSRERGGLDDLGGFARKKATKDTKAFCDLCAFCGQLAEAGAPGGT